MQLIRELERTRDETLKCFSLDHRDLVRTYAPGKWSLLAARRFLLRPLSYNAREEGASKQERAAQQTESGT